MSQDLLTEILKLDCFNSYMRERIEAVGKTFPKTDAEIRVSKLEKAMLSAMIGGCSCQTETSIFSYHKDHCGYKILGEALSK